MAVPSSRPRRAGRARPAAGAAPPRRGRRGATAEAGSRDRLCAAAAAEFAARGFAGANVDRIARVARVNKAMIYYHFKSKAALYQEILGDMFRAVAARVRAVAASDLPPDEKVRRFVDGLATEAEARPHFPRMWFREIAEGGAHLGDRALEDIAGIVQTLASILNEGVRAKRFGPVHPLLVHAGIVGPVLLFFASAPLRQRLERAGVGIPVQLSRDAVVAHVQRVTLGALEGKM